MSTKFPGPYVNECKIEDPMMHRIDIHKMGIGARNVAMPKSIKNSMSIDHIGGSEGKKQ